MKNWPTREQDLYIARMVIEEYASLQKDKSLGLFELVFDQKQKAMGFKLSNWVLTLVEHYRKLYGNDQGDFVTRQVISNCLTQGHTIH